MAWFEHGTSRTSTQHWAAAIRPCSSQAGQTLDFWNTKICRGVPLPQPTPLQFNYALQRPWRHFEPELHGSL